MLYEVYRNSRTPVVCNRSRRSKDELEAERLAEGRMYDVLVEEFHPHDNGGCILSDANLYHDCHRGKDAMQAAECHCMD